MEILVGLILFGLVILLWPYIMIGIVGIGVIIFTIVTMVWTFLIHLFKAKA